MRFPGFIGANDAGQSRVANSERLMNWYVEPLPRGSKNDQMLLPTPGQTSKVSVSDIGTRGLLTMNDRVFAVIATGIYGIDSTFTATKYGTLSQDNNPASLTTNGTPGGEAFYGSGTNGYVHDLTANTITQELTGDVTQVGMLDGYFIAFNKTTSRIRISDLNDGTTWDPTQFLARTTAPDNWQAMVVNPPDIWLIGSQTGDVLFDSGAFPFPLEPRPGATFKYGTPATFSAIALGDSVLWLSQNAEGAGIVVEARGYTPQRISTPAVETRIAGYARTAKISDAEAFGYQQEGHEFYVLRFPSAQATEVYDLTTGQWHERGTWRPSLNRYDCWHPRCHTYAFGQHLVGESGTGTISALDVTVGTEPDTTAIRRLRITPSLFREAQATIIHRLEVLMEMGLGTSTGQGSDPMAMLEISDDGGKTYGRQRQGSVGKIGAYQQRLVWTRLGLFSDAVVRFTFSDPIPARVIDAYINNDGQGA